MVDHYTEDVPLDDEDHGEAYLHLHQKRNRKRHFNHQRRRLFFGALLTSWLVLAGLYLVGPTSRIKVVDIRGNQYLSNDQVLTAGGVNSQSYFWLTLDFFVEGQLRQHPFIAAATVTHCADRTLIITIVEQQPLGYRYLDKPEILLVDGTLIQLDDTMVKLIADVPFIVGFESDELRAALAKAFVDVQPAKISQISEIHQFAVSYDPNMIRLVMQDGNQFFASFYSMEALNHYNEIASSLKVVPSCIFVDEMTKSAYTQTCPGDEVSEGDKTEDENSDTNS